MTTKNCCCCYFNLRTGNIIIACFDVLSIYIICFSYSSAQFCVVPFIAGLLSLYAIYKVIPIIIIEYHSTNRLIKIFSLTTTAFPLAVIDCSRHHYKLLDILFNICHYLDHQKHRTCEQKKRYND